MANQPKRYKKFVATAATATLVASAIAPVASASFKDVADNNDHKKNIEAIAELGYMGAGDNFRPAENVTRGQVAIILANWAQDVAGLEVPADYKTVQRFKDVPLTADDKLLQSAALVKDYGIFEGSNGNLNGANPISREHMALVLNKAFEAVNGTSLLDLAGDTSDVTFADEAKINKNYLPVVKALKKLGITAPASFNPSGNVTRGQFATFFMQTVNQEAEEVVVDSVVAINDTKLEVTFGKAIDEDLAVEIEKSGERFVVYNGGKTANSTVDSVNVFKSQTINFNADRTKADIILSAPLESDVAYTVALMSGDNNVVSSVVKKFGPKVLRKGAETPEITVNAAQDKIILNFKTKMDAAALTASNYEVFESTNQTTGVDLADIVTSAGGAWVDATTKTAVEFKLDSSGSATKLLAGKTYTVKVDATNVKTDEGKELSATQKSIVVKTPSLTEAEPVAKVARVNGKNIIVTFDKDISSSNFNVNQITIKKPGGERIAVTDASTVIGKELTIETNVTLDTDLTYTIELPSNGVANAYFPNASNKAVTGLKAVAQKDIEVTSLSAKLVKQVDNKAKADLLLTFDQRVDVTSLDTTKIVIKDGGDTYTAQAGTAVGIYPGDATGKTIVIKDVETEFKKDGGDGFVPLNGKSYTVEIAANTVKTYSGSKTNQEKLKAVIGGVSVSEPVLDKVTLNSADEIVLTFEEDIDASNLKASHIKVQGYELYDNGKFAPATLQGDSQIKFTASGNKLTIKPANAKVKFETAFDTDLVEIAKESLKGKVSGVANSSAIDDLTGIDNVDYAKPIIIGATYVDGQNLNITYSENVKFKAVDATNNAEATQFTVENASKAGAYGTAATIITNVIKVTFSDANTFKTDLDLSKVKVKYAKTTQYEVQDTAASNAADSQTITGVAK